MPKIIYVEASGERHQVEAAVGESLMQVALDNLVPGIEGDCGGACSCGTCHAYITADHWHLMPDMRKDETTMLKCAVEVRDNSRLCCQLSVQEDWDGLLVHLPESQY